MRLIDADALLAEYDRIHVGEPGRARKLIEEQPTVDAVDVVRCKDCKYFSFTTLGMQFACWHEAYKIFGETGEHASHTICTRIDSEEHFCSYGERSDNADQRA